MGQQQYRPVGLEGLTYTHLAAAVSLSIRYLEDVEMAVDLGAEEVRCAACGKTRGYHQRRGVAHVFTDPCRWCGDTEVSHGYAHMTHEYNQPSNPWVPR